MIKVEYLNISANFGGKKRFAQKLFLFHYSGATQQPKNIPISLEWILSLTKDRGLEAAGYLRIPGVDLPGGDAHFFPVSDLEYSKYLSIIHGGSRGGWWL